MKLLIILLFAISCQACTIYRVQSTSPDGKEVKVSVYSSREFEQPTLHYSRKGNDAEFDFGAESATTYDPYSKLIEGILTGTVTVQPQ